MRSKNGCGARQLGRVGAAREAQREQHLRLATGKGVSSDHPPLARVRHSLVPEVTREARGAAESVHDVAVDHLALWEGSCSTATRVFKPKCAALEGTNAKGVVHGPRMVAGVPVHARQRVPTDADGIPSGLRHESTKGGIELANKVLHGQCGLGQFMRGAGLGTEVEIPRLQRIC